MVRRIMTTTTLIAVGCFSMLQAETGLKFSGDVQYRIQYQYATADSGSDDPATSANYSYPYWWNLFGKAVVNENLLFGIRFSNPMGYWTDVVDENTEWVREARTDGESPLAIPEFYFKWSTSPFYLMAGIIPVPGNTVLDLVVFEDLGYVNTILLPWTVALNNSQAGARIGTSLALGEGVNLGLDLLATIAQEGGSVDPENLFAGDQHRFLLTAPISFEKQNLTVMPEFHTRTAVVTSPDLDEVNNSYAVGGDVKYAPLDNLSLKLGYGVAWYSNSALSDNVDTIAAKEPRGMLLNSGFTYAPGFGNLAVDFSIASWRDDEAVENVAVTFPFLEGHVVDIPGTLKDPVAHNLYYADLKYSLPYKSLSFIPRLRIWYWNDSETDVTGLWVRPELLFSAAF